MKSFQHGVEQSNYDQPVHAQTLAEKYKLPQPVSIKQVDRLPSTGPDSLFHGQDGGWRRQRACLARTSQYWFLELEG